MTSIERYDTVGRDREYRFSTSPVAHNFKVFAMEVLRGKRSPLNFLSTGDYRCTEFLACVKRASRDQTFCVHPLRGDKELCVNSQIQSLYG